MMSCAFQDCATSAEAPSLFVFRYRDFRHSILVDDTLTSSRIIDHARLKEHVASMEGGLEARIHEAGE
jgi:hypothetical protein